MWMAFIAAAIMNLGSYWFSDTIVLSAYQARPVRAGDAPELIHMVQNLSQRAALPMPRVYVVPSAAPNAFATGRSPSNAVVAVTTGLVNLLSPEELNGVMAHELAHVEHRDTLIGAIAATIAGAITLLAQSARIFGVPEQRDEHGRERSNMIVILLMIFLAPFAAVLIRMAISRSREYAADARGAEISGQPLALASALRKLDTASRSTPLFQAEAHPTTTHMLIVNPLRSFSLANLFSTHPPIAERIRRLEAMQTSTRFW
jgi:heat shock protein HtpX